MQLYDMQLYDEVPYPLLTHSSTHPDRMAVVGRLMGLHPGSPDACTVLELGCGHGANLIAMAELLPDSRFLGVDYSARQIQEGNDIVSSLGLKNIELRHADILDLPDALDSFDYIIAHGLYSWVPNPVREKALRLIKHSLAPEGIAFVSYNAYPGWHQLKALRDMMLYRARGISDPVEQAHAAREFISLLAESQTEASPFAAFVRHYHSSFQGRGPVPESQFVATLLHDELSEVNDPFYFSEFVANANAAGLQFLAEADLEGSTPVGLSSDVVARLSSFAGDRIEMEQYLDFIRNRNFRRTLLCHEEAPVARTLHANRNALAGLYVGSPARPQRRRRRDAPGSVRFLSPEDVEYSTDQPTVQAVLRHLARVYPRVVAFEELHALASRAVRGRDAPPPAEADALASVLLRNFLYSRSLVELYVAPRHVESRVSARPRTTAFARYMANLGADSVTNVRHARVQLSNITMALVPLLDGQHDIESLLAAAEAVSPTTSRREVEDRLRWLARAGVLVA